MNAVARGARRNPADTPLMRQFLEVKADHPDAIVFFRMGDFYEMFFEDAVIAARALDLTLTSRDKGHEDAVPMCGVPHHAGRGYLARLTELGHKVVVVEQTEEEVLEPKRARYLAAVVRGKGTAGIGVAHLDASTGELRATWVADGETLAGELGRIAPRELLVAKEEAADKLPGCALTASEPPDAREAEAILGDLAVDASGALEAAGLVLARRAAASCVKYARATQPIGALPVVRLQLYRIGDAVVLDETAIVNLELLSTILPASGSQDRRAGSLLAVLDDTVTAPGGRLLRRWLLYPLVEVAPIRRRQDAVEHLVLRQAVRERVRRELGEIRDLERLAGRASLGVATPRDLGQLRASLHRLPALAEALAEPGRGAIELPEMLAIGPGLLAELAELERELAAALVDEPPPVLKDGGVIRDGFCPLVDDNRRLADGGRDAILAIEQRERERTGISSLRVRYNRVFGYYLEVTKSQLARVPADYVRKQTIATGERYVTTELADLEARILAAQETLVAREAELFRTLVGQVARRTGVLLKAAAQVAAIDVGAALAQLAHSSGWTRPLCDDGEVIEIEEGRHPVVERMVTAGQGGQGGSFVPNDCRLDPAGRQILLITGPNMAGKSTYMRQVAHIVLLAQMGAFVPARAARVGLVDRIFTRVGAADNLARGDSTFMVEMRETAAILAGATRRSLVVLDEVGRGTSTFDGLSIAWAVAEYLHDAIGCRTLFATHFHELCALAETRPRVVNLQAAAREVGGRIVFLRQIVPGGASRSYGIEVARLAGLPGSVLTRAREVLADLDGQRLGNQQLPLFTQQTSTGCRKPETGSRKPEPSPDPMRDRLSSFDLDSLTPLQALNLLAELRSLL